MKVNESILNELNRINWTHGTCVLGGVLLATLIRFPIDPAIHNYSPFLFYFPVVLAAAIICGRKFGLLATVLSVVPANYYWMGAERAFEINFGEFCQILGFSFAGFSVSWLSDTARKRKQLEEHLRATLASLGDAIVTTDCRGRIVYLNAAAQLLSERRDQELNGCRISDALNLMAEDGGQSLDGTFQAAVTSGEIEDLPKQVIIISPSGRQYPVEQRASRILDGNGKSLGTAILFRRCGAGDGCSPMLPAQKKSTR